MTASAVSSWIALSSDDTFATTDAAEPRDLREHLARASLEAKLTGSTVQPMVGGRYAILEIVGKGGMGEVCRGIDRELQREVALKFVHTSGSIETAHRRLALEAKALARVSDPHVVPVFDIVADPLGLCVVMEYVRGIDLRAWLRVAPRSPSEILDVLDAAARGLAAAHGAGVIHRDVKPDNVMLGDDGRVRVVDFGLAQPRARIDDDGESTVDAGAGLTQVGMLVGTAGYLAPELYAGRAADAQSDQLALSVMAYEALLGRKPISTATIAALAERGPSAWRLEPPIADRRVSARVIAVVTRGLAADPSARHASIDAWRHALRRARRMRPTIAAAAIGITATVITGFVITAEPAPARCDAGPDDGDLWSPARAQALRDAFATSGLPYAAAAAEQTIAAIAARVDVLAETHAELCAIDRDALERDAARACLLDRRRELDDRIALYLLADRDIVAHAAESAAALPDPWLCTTPEHVEGREALTLPQRELRRELDRAFALADAGKLDDATTAAEGAQRALRDAGDAAGANDATRLLGEIASDQGDYTNARVVLEAAYFDATSRDDAPRAFSAASDLVSLHAHRLARLDDAALWLRHLQALAQQSPSPEREARLAAAEAGVLLATGRYDAAIARYTDAAAQLTAIDRTSTPRLVWIRQDLALALARAGQHAHAERTFVEVLAVAESIWGTEHPSWADILENHANVVDDVGRSDEALAMHERVLAVRVRALGEHHPHVGGSLTNIGTEHETRGNHALARDFHVRALAVQRATLGELHPAVAASLNNLGNTLANLGDIDGAQDAYDEALEITERTVGPDDPSVALLLSNLGTCHEARGAHSQARIVLTRSLAIRERALGPRHPDTAYSLHNLGVVELADGHPERAIPLLTRVLEIREHGGDPYLLATTRQSLAEALRAREPASARARTLSSAARASFVALGRTDEVAAVDAWNGR